MQTVNRSVSIERMLESADHLIEKHREGPAKGIRAAQQLNLPEGWILYSARFALEGAQKGWHVELMNTSQPFRTDSIVAAWDNQSLDAALQEASHKVPASGSEVLV